MTVRTYRADDGVFKRVEDLTRAEIESILQRNADYQRGWTDGHNGMVKLVMAIAQAIAGAKHE